MCTPIKDHSSFAQLDVMRPMRISDASNERRITLWSLGTNAGKEGRPNREKNLCNTNTYTNRREFRNDSNLWSIFRPMIKPPLPARSMCPRFHTYLLPWTPDKHTTGRSSTQVKKLAFLNSFCTCAKLGLSKQKLIFQAPHLVQVQKVVSGRLDM